ncbi:permease prefix domain 1-containing protein [Christensenella tenuis]|uniref:Cell division protein FtsW n=1 Tax=Christensenella tenuis TaxID=2763033 RepID=A0ABR7EH10_9FIRM|nr:hypothetical protein [Christensenella tenuis]
MNKPDGVTAYIKTVCEQIRWKKARPAVADELETHILDQRDALILAGIEPGAATSAAIAEMGDAVTVGTMLDHSYRPRIGWKTLVCMLAVIMCSCLLPVLLYRSSEFANLAYFVSVGLCVAIALPFLFIDFTSYAKIPVILLSVLIACIALAGAGVSIFWRTETVAAYLLPFAFLLMLFHMRGGGFRKFLRCCLLFIILPSIGYVLFFYFRYYGYLSPRAWLLLSINQSFIIFVLSCAAMMAICVCCGFFAVNKKKALLTLLIPTAAFTVLFLLYSAEAQLYESQAGFSQMNLIRETLENAVLFGQGHIVAEVSTNEVTRLIFRIGWLPFFGILAAGAGVYLYLLKQCLRQRSMLGRSLSLMGWAALVIPTVLGTASAAGVLPNAYSVIPFLSIDSSIYASMVLGLLCNIFRTGDVVRDRMVHAVA